MLPGTSPMLFDTLAMTGGKPNASRVGNVISEPEPTTALTPPAAVPAARIASASPGPTGSSHDRRVGDQVPPGRARSCDVHHVLAVSAPARPGPSSGRPGARSAAGPRSTWTGSAR